MMMIYHLPQPADARANHLVVANTVADARALDFAAANAVAHAAAVARVRSLVEGDQAVE